MCGKEVDFDEPWCAHETMEESAWLNIPRQAKVEKAAQDAIDRKQEPLTPKEAHDLALQIIIDEAVEESAKELGWQAGNAVAEQMKKEFDS
jgi:hypothetical protein